MIRFCSRILLFLFFIFFLLCLNANDEFKYAYDALGRVTRVDITGHNTNTITYAYNSRDELIEMHYDNHVFKWNYDLVGNLTSREEPGITNYFSCNSLNQYTSINSPRLGQLTLTYDADGNLTRCGMRHYKWDVENRLISVHWPASSNTIFSIVNTYDYLGRRIQKRLYESLPPPNPPTTNTLYAILHYTSTFVYDDDMLVYEKATFRDGHIEEREFFWGPDLSGSIGGMGGIGGLVAISYNGYFYFPLYDAFGNIYGYINENKQLVAVRILDPFAAPVARGGELCSKLPFWHATKYYDQEVDLYYFGKRYYYPLLNRWLNRDPCEEEGGENLYRYNHNNPLKYHDPDGGIPLDTIWDLGNIIYDICVGDSVALAADTAALLIPYVPAGATKAAGVISSVVKGDKTYNLVKSAPLSEVKGFCKKPKKLEVTYEYGMSMQDRSKHFLPKAELKSNWIVRTGGKQSSRFIPGMGDKEVKQLIEEALKEAKRQGKIKPSDIDSFIYDTKKFIGASKGKKATKIKIHINRDGKELHAFPWND